MTGSTNVGSTNRQALLDWEEKKAGLLTTWCKLPVFNGCSRKFVMMALDLTEGQQLKHGEMILKQDFHTEDLLVVEKGVLTLGSVEEVCAWTLPVNEYVTSLAILGLQGRAQANVTGGPGGTLIRKLNMGSLMTCAFECQESGHAIDKRKANINSIMLTLKSMDFFHKYREMKEMPELSDDFVMLIAERIIQSHYDEGEHVVFVDEEGDDMYIMEDGECVAEVSCLNVKPPKPRQTTFGTSEMKEYNIQRNIRAFRKDLSASKKFNEMVTVQTYTPGDVFGEMGMLGISKTRTASIRVTSAKGATVLCLRRDDLRMVLAQFPQEKRAFEEYVEELARANLLAASCEAQLRSAAYFAKSDVVFCDMLQAFCERRIVLPGELIVQEGMPGDDKLYVIHKGQLNVELLGKPIAELTEGQCFGEATMLRLSPKYTASIRTTTLVSLMILTHDIFEEALERFPKERQRFQALFQARLLKEHAKVGPEGHAFFQEGDPRFLQRINGTLHMEVFMPDQIIVAEGDVGTSMFILTTGKAEVQVRGIKVFEYQAGSVFGELTLLGIASRRTATIKAVTVCIAEILHQHVFEDAINEFPQELRRIEELAAAHLGKNCDYAIYSWPIFEHFPSRFLYLLDIHLVRLVHFTGTAIVDVNAPQSSAIGNNENIDWSSSMFTLLQGKAAVIDNGNETHVLQEGDIFGEMAVLGIPTPPTTKVIARTMCDIHLLRKEDVDAAFLEFPEERNRLQDNIAKYIARKGPTKNGQGEGGAKSLRRATVFHSASNAFLDHLWDNLETHLFMPGTDIVTEGEMSQPCMYILQSGVAVVLAKDVEVSQFSPGSYFGEIGLLGASTKRTATVRAKDPCVVQILWKDQYTQAQQQYPDNNAGFQALQKLAGGRLGDYLRRTIEQLPLFAESDPTFLDAVCEGLEEKTFAPGEIVVSEEDPMTHSVMVLVSGSLTMSVGGIQMGFIQAGELAIFGEISGLGIGKWRPATLTCAKDQPSLVVVIDQAIFERALTDHPEELARFQMMDAQRRRRASKKLKAHKSWLQSVHFELSENVTFFRSCSKQFMWEVTEMISETCHPPKSILAEERQTAESMIILLEGTADILVDNVRLGKLRAAAVFGDENVLGFPWRTATLQARSACRMVTLQSDTLWDVLNDTDYASERRYFEELRCRRAEAGARLQTLPAFAKCEPLCLQQVALRTNRIRISRGHVWVPGEDIEHQGEAFSIFMKGSAHIELGGLQVLVLTPGTTFADKIVHRYGGVVRATSRSELYSLRRHDLSAAVLHFPKAQPWFDVFCSQQNHECRQLQLKLVAKRAEADAFLPHPKDNELKHWAKVKDFHRKVQNPKAVEDGRPMSDRSSRNASPRRSARNDGPEKAAGGPENSAGAQEGLSASRTLVSSVTLKRHPLKATPRTMRKLFRKKRRAQEEKQMQSSALAKGDSDCEPPEMLSANDLTANLARAAAANAATAAAAAVV